MNKILTKEKYNNEVLPALKKKFGYKNNLEVPKLINVKVNIGLGEALTNSKALESMSEALRLITGQKPVETKAKKAISNFKIRKGDVIGLIVTMRGNRMWYFLDRLINIVLPRVRDFRGLSENSFDTKGNYSLGIKEHVVFPEIDPNTVDKIRGLGINIVTTAETREEGLELLKLLGMPFKKKIYK